MGKGLWLSRRPGDKVYIGDDIEITVESVVGNDVRLSIKAPASMGVHRDFSHVGLKIAANIKKGR